MYTHTHTHTYIYTYTYMYICRSYVYISVYVQGIYMYMCMQQARDYGESTAKLMVLHKYVSICNAYVYVTGKRLWRKYGETGGFTRRLCARVVPSVVLYGRFQHRKKCTGYAAATAVHGRRYGRGGWGGGLRRRIGVGEIKSVE